MFIWRAIFMEQAVKMYVLLTTGLTCMFVMLAITVSFNNTGHAFASDVLTKCETQTTTNGDLCVFSGSEETCNIRFPSGYDVCDSSTVVNGKIYNLTSPESS